MVAHKRVARTTAGSGPIPLPASLIPEPCNLNRTIMSLTTLPYIMVNGEETRIDNIEVTEIETLPNGRQLVSFIARDGSQDEGYVIGGSRTTVVR